MSPRGKGPPSDGVLAAPENPTPQTELDQTQITPEAEDNSANPQTEPILKVQPRKKVSARDILPSSGKPKTEQEAEPEAAEEPIPRKRIKLDMPVPNTEILAIDDELGVQTEMEKARDKFLDLVESLKTGRYLTDRI